MTMGARNSLDTSSQFGSRNASFFERLVWKASNWKAIPQEWRRRLRKRFARKVIGPFDVVNDGMKFRLYPAENYCDRVLFGRGELPERAEHEALLPLIRPGMVFVDIGANVGTYSIFVGKQLGGDLALISFEPHPRTFEKLLFNLTVNDLPTDHIINAGVGPESTTMTLWSDGGSNIGHTSLLRQGTANAKIGIEVPIAPLLETLHERSIDHVDILKVDVEGFEDQALVPFLKSADEKLLPNHILIEVTHKNLWESDLGSLLSELRYKQQFATEENWLLSREIRT